MILKFKSSDAPTADGKIPIHGESEWTLTIPLEGGMDYLELHIGDKGRNAIKAILAQEDHDLTLELIE